MKSLLGLSTLAAIVLGFGYEVLSREAIAIQCDSDRALVQKGASKLEVLSKCGQPDLVESSGSNTVGQFQTDTQRGFGNSSRGGTFGTQTSVVEKWHYNCGEGRFIKTLVFVNGVLQSIQEGERGTGPNKCT